MSETERVPIGVVIGILALVAAGSGADLLMDRPTNFLTPHVLLELVVLFSALGTATYLLMGWRRTEASLTSARRSIAERTAERDAWQRNASDALRSLGEAIDRQFSVWSLTPVEREIALLLLKGLGHKQIAGATNRSERTVRQHAVSIYEKAGVSGRAELAAFFLSEIAIPKQR